MASRAGAALHVLGLCFVRHKANDNILETKGERQWKKFGTPEFVVATNKVKATQAGSFCAIHALDRGF